MDSSSDYRISKMPIKAARKEQARNLSFLKRKRGLTKKVEELTVLCGIDACVICFSPPQNKKRRYDSSSSTSFSATQSLEVWPETDRVLEMVNKYRSLPREDQENKKLDNSRFLSEKINKVNAELSKRRKENRDLETQMMWPSMELFLSKLSQNQLDDFLKDIDAKIEATHHRIQTLRKKEENSLLNTPQNVLESQAISEGVQNWSSNRFTKFAGLQGLQSSGSKDGNLGSICPSPNPWISTHLPPYNYNSMDLNFFLHGYEIDRSRASFYPKQQEPFIEQMKCDIPDVCALPAMVSELGFSGERHRGSNSSSNDQLNVCRCDECLVNELLAGSADVTIDEDTVPVIMNNRFSSIAGVPGERHHGSSSSLNAQLNVCRCDECLVNELLAECTDVTVAEDTVPLIMNNRLSTIARW